MPARSPRPQISIASWDDADEHLRLLGETTRKRQALKLTLDRRLERAREAVKGRLAPLIALEKAIPDALESFATAHRDDFGASKTKALAHGDLRFYLPPPSVQPLSRKWTWDLVGRTIRDVCRRLLVSAGIWPRDKAEPVHIVAAADTIEGGLCLNLDSPIAHKLLRNGRWFRVTCQINKERLLGDYANGKVADARAAEDAAAEFLERHRLTDSPCRFDVVALTRAADGGQWRIELFRDAF